MPSSFYDSVDALLAKPPPQLRQVDSSLPQLRKQRSELRKGFVPTKRRQHVPSQRQRVDLGLVDEAMRYCDELKRRAFLNEGEDCAKPSKEVVVTKTTRMSPKLPKRNYPYNKKGGPASATEKSSAKEKPAKDDVDALVRNFQTGAHLRELRQQLHESQKSMHHSRNYIASLAQSWHADQ